MKFSTTHLAHEAAHAKAILALGYTGDVWLLPRPDGSIDVLTDDELPAVMLGKSAVVGAAVGAFFRKLENGQDADVIWDEVMGCRSLAETGIWDDPHVSSRDKELHAASGIGDLVMAELQFAMQTAVGFQQDKSFLRHLGEQLAAHGEVHFGFNKRKQETLQ